MEIEINITLLDLIQGHRKGQGHICWGTDISGVILATGQKTAWNAVV